MAKKKFYVTTPIYYPNDIPHIGHAYTTLAADVLARWHKIKGEDVWFLTGTDEHGKKIEETATNKGKNPKEFVDELVPKFKEAWKKLGVSYDKFIRTTDKDHEKIVKDVLQKVFDKGDIYLGEYEGFYCTGCEAYYTKKDLEDGCCPIHKKKVEVLKEPSYFFKLSKYQKNLLNLYKKGFILPKTKEKEIINRVEKGLNDLSISRTSFDWGIELPFDKKHIAYVWFDALLNYYSGSGKGKKYWPADVHLIGKDILWFHVVYWPAMLMSAGIKLPKNVFAHGWWTFDKEKISKSRGKVIKIDELVSIAGVDAARYFLMRATPFGQDGDFSTQELIRRHNDELANNLGNLVSRVSGLIEKNGMSKIENKLLEKLDVEKIERLFENYEFDKVLNEVFSFVDVCNEYVQNKKPWETKDKKVLYEVADSIKAIGILLFPFTPETCEKIAKQFGFKIDYKEISKPLKVSDIIKGEVLFRKIDFEKVEKQKINKEPQVKEIMENVGQVKFEDWGKLDLRIAEIKKVENVEGADKLWKLTLDVGPEIKERIVCAGLKEFYNKKDLKGKKIIYFSNLKPRKMRGVLSEGMLLAASSEEKGKKKVVLISPVEDIENGATVG